MFVLGNLKETGIIYSPTFMLQLLSLNTGYYGFKVTQIQKQLILIQLSQSDSLSTILRGFPWGTTNRHHNPFP